MLCNFWYQLKSLTIPEAIRHPTRETQEHRVTNTHFAAAPSAYGCSCRMCDFLGRMVLLKKTAPIKFLCWCLLWFAKRRDLVAFLRCKHTPQAIGPAAAKTQQRRAPSTLAAAVSRGQGLYCLVLCVLGECVCVWSPTTSGTKGAGPAWCTQSGFCAHWEACGDQRRNSRGPPKRSTCPVATPPHKSLYSFTRLEQHLIWPVKKEQQLALAAEGESAIYRARSAEH